MRLNRGQLAANFSVDGEPLGNLVVSETSIRAVLCRAVPVSRCLAAMLFIAPLSLYLVLSSDSNLHHDIWHQLALFREAVKLGYLPTKELFAYTASLDVSMQHEWGAGAVAWAFLLGGGAGGLVFLKFSLMLPVVFSFWMQARARSTTSTIASLLAMAASFMVSYSNVPVWAQSYSLAMFSMLIWFLFLDRNGNRVWPAICVSLFVLWVNLHGGFVVGLGVLVTYAIEQYLRKKKWLHIGAVILCCLACIGLTPYGIGFYKNIFHGVAMDRTFISEWSLFWPLRSVSLRGCVFLLSLGLTAYVFIKVGWRHFEGIFIITLMGIATMRAEKVIPLYAVVWFSVLVNAAKYVPLARLLERFGRREPGTMLVALGVFSLVCLAVFGMSEPWRLQIRGTAPDKVHHLIYPVGPVDYLKSANFRGNVMTPFEQGAYVSWKLYPNVRVGCDSRYEVAYDPAWVSRVMEMYTAPKAGEWEKVLAAYPTDLVLVRRTMKFNDVISHSSQWSRIYTDDTWRLYAREGLSLSRVDHTGETIEGTIP